MKQLIVFTCFLLLTQSCRRDEHEATRLSNNEIINSWIAENIEQYYLWNDRITASGINKDENPRRFFEQLIAPDDSYSYIVDDFKSLLLKWSKNHKPGYSYLLYSTDSDTVYGKITYIVTDSPADRAGLKRGMVFTKINGTNLSADNYNDLTAETVHEHTLSVRENDNSETARRIEVAEFVEPPVFLDTVYALPDCKVGYLVYNSFISDNGDMSKKYDIQLNDIFEKFGNDDIDELILDLRYNQQGNIFSSVILASMIVPDPDTEEIYARYQYNKSVQATVLNEFGDDYLNLYFVDMLQNKAINNVSLNRVFILTSPTTGAIGKVLINCLRPFIDVIIVGNETAGNNVFSFFLYEEDPEIQRINTWAIILAVMKISNRAGNTDYAFTPDIKITEPLYDNTPLGNINETVLSATLNAISGDSTLNSVSAPVSESNIRYLSLNIFDVDSLISLPYFSSALVSIIFGLPATAITMGRPLIFSL
jgi:hypothetical protein